MDVILYEKILKVNDYLANENSHLFGEHNVLAVGVLGSPGAGKTTLVEKSIESLLAVNVRPAVLVGDLATTRDAERIQKFGIPCAQLTTSGACHLEAQQIGEALRNLKLSEIDVLFIENVGNLVCPTAYHLGERIRTVILSVPEGDDKVEKYPATFKKADCIVLNKIDYLQIQPFDVEKVRGEAKTLNPEAVWFQVSCVTGEGIEEWIRYLLDLKAG